MAGKRSRLKKRIKLLEHRLSQLLSIENGCKKDIPKNSDRYLVREISRSRFNAFAAYCRDPRTLFMAAEVRWYQVESEKIVAAVIQDFEDGNFHGIVFAPDERDRFRWINATDWYGSIDEACENLKSLIIKLLPKIEDERKQGDSTKRTVDFFTPLSNAKKPLHPFFKRLAYEDGHSPARSIIELMMRWHEDVDGNFVEQFQTDGFDARTWELYLFAAFSEGGYIIDPRSKVPDFICQGIEGEFCIEATTVNPSLDKKGNIVPPPSSSNEKEMKDILNNYVPIKFAGPLTTKLGKKYWNDPNVTGKPFLLAIQDFHAPLSMTYSREALVTYLYGYKHRAERDKDNNLQIVPISVKNHQWGSKVIDSGFFKLKNSENISAVIFNASATISKFNRMGVMNGFGSNRVRLVREGLVTDLDSNASKPLPFRQKVNSPTYKESWMEGMDVFHNPLAKHPLDQALLPNAAHHRLLEDGQIESTIPVWHPVSSLTSIFIMGD